MPAGRLGFFQVVGGICLKIGHRLNGSHCGISIAGSIIGNREQCVAAALGLIQGTIHCPGGVAKCGSGLVHLVPLNTHTLGVELTAPREVMAFLVHIDDGRRVDCPAIMLGLSRVVHAEIFANIHAAVSGHVRFEATVRHHDAAEHVSRWIVVNRGVGERIGLGVPPVCLIRMQLGDGSVRGLATLDSDGRGIRKVPHDLLCNLGIQIAGLISSDVSVRDLGGTGGNRIGCVRSAPPETPTGAHGNRRLSSSRIVHHIHQHRSIIRNIAEPEIQTFIIVVQRAGLDFEDLHAGCSITVEYGKTLIASIEIHAYLVGSKTRFAVLIASPDRLTCILFCWLLCKCVIFVVIVLLAFVVALCGSIDKRHSAVGRHLA